jgi:hypothetical protein
MQFYPSRLLELCRPVFKNTPVFIKQFIWTYLQSIGPSWVVNVYLQNRAKAKTNNKIQSENWK